MTEHSPSNDVLRRLRQRSASGGCDPIGSTLIDSAIAEIERLRAALARIAAGNIFNPVLYAIETLLQSTDPEEGACTCGGGANQPHVENCPAARR